MSIGSFDERREVFLRDAMRRLVIDPSLLDERNEQRAGARRHAGVGICGMDGALVRAAS